MNTVKEVMLKQPDGVQLYTLLALPEADGRFPVIVIRNPYCSTAPDLEAWRTKETHGYAVVLQHCRGTGRSEGVCVPYVHEREDGLALLDWIRQQAFYQGELFLSGGSYLSSVHYAWMNVNPPDVKAAFLPVQDTERYNILYRNGFFKPGLHGFWSMTMYKRNQSIERNMCDDTFRTMPLTGVTKTVFNELVPQLEEEYRHPDPADAFWQTPAGGADYHDAVQRCTFPILLTTAFYDIYTGGVLDIWNRMTPERRRNCACIVSPFDHAWNPPRRTQPSEVPDFENARLNEICPDLEYEWFDHFRKGTPLHFVEEGKITYYTLFENKWHTAVTLVNGTEARRFYLAGDRTLQDARPPAGEITYAYNPYAPATFAGGVCHGFGGMQLQAAPNSRYDIISFVSKPLEETVIAQGKFELELHCRSTAPDTCFYVRLDLVRNGKTISLRDDIDSLCRLQKDYVPGTERVLKFTFVEHSFQIQAGDQLRLDVSSSCVPHFQVHTNRKGLLADHDGADPCRNTVLVGDSTLTLYLRKG